MARTFVAASSQYLVQAAAPVTSTPLTLATWIRVANTAAPFKAALSVCSGAGSDHATLYCEGSNLRAQARGGAAGTGATVSGLSAGTWQHAAGVYASSTSKIAYLNGTPGSTETTSYTFGTLDRVAVGVAIQTTPTGEYFDGDIAESAIWNVALTVDEIAALAKGFNPRFIRPASLVAYWPITGNDSPELDRWKSRYDLTLNGTPAKADHPRMIARSRVQVGLGPTVAPATPNTPAPADASTRQSRTPTFTWSASGATSYDVYFGTAASPPLVSSGQAGASYMPAGPLSSSTVYYWKIVAINSAGSTTGPIWSFTTLNPFELLLRIAGVTPHMRIAGLNIRNLLNEAPNTCSFTVDGTAPTVGQDVQIGLGSLAPSDLLFAGTIENVDQIYQGGKAVNIAWLVRCQDYTRTLNRRKVRIRYGQQSATLIAVDLVSRYTTGFTTVGVVAALPTVTGGIDFTDEDVMACLRRLASRIGGYADVDYGKDVKLFLTDTSTPPDDLALGLRSLGNDDPPVTYAIDVSQVRTRVWVEGGGATAKAFIAAGGTTLPVDDATWYVTPGGTGIVVSGPQRITYTGVVTGGAGALVGTTVTPTNGPTVTKRAGTGLTAGTVSWATTFKTAAGETLPGPLTTVVMGGAVDPPIAPSAVKKLGGSLSAGAYQWKLAHVDSNGNETLCGTASASVTMDDVAAPTTIGAASTYFPPSNLVGPGTYGWEYTFRNHADTTKETLPSPASTLVLGSGGQGAKLAKSGTQTAPSGFDRVFYRTAVNGATYKLMHGASDGFGSNDASFFYDDTEADAALGAAAPSSSTAIYRSALLTLPTTAPAGVVTLRVYRTAVGGSTFKKDGDVSIGTATYLSTIADGSLGTTELSVATSFYLAADLSNIPIGPATTTGRGNYRTIAGGATLKLQSSFANNTSTSLTDTTADGSLGATAPVTDTSGLTVQTGEVAAGSTSVLVTSTAPFQAAGGWAFIGSLPIRYTGFSGTALTGVPSSGIGALTTTVRYAVEIVAAPMLTGIPPSGAGSILYDILSGDPVNLLVQCDDVGAQAALATMEGGDSDGIYEHTIQDRRLSFAEATATGYADLALFSRPIVTIHYASHDPKTRSGKTVHVNLPSLGLVGDWTIQSVTIDQIGVAANTYPRYTVDASSVRFSFESVLRLLALKVA